jgi:hypothetical protein
MLLVHMNNTTYCASQKKAPHKPTASSQPPKTNAHSEPGPAKVPDETEAEPSGVQDNVDVRVHFLRLTAGAHCNYLIDERMRCLIETRSKTPGLSFIEFVCRGSSDVLV